MHATNRLAIAVCLFLFLTATLFLTYGGAFVSDDEVILFDATESLARRGNLGLNLAVNLRDSPVLDSEPMQAIAAAPLFWLVERIPGVGMAHGVLIFNNLVTSLTAGLFFLYATALGYRVGAAALAALLFGVATIAWPYSKAFFREPLTGFFLLLTAYALERWRQAFMVRRAHRRWIALGGAAFVASLFTKEAIFFALPALVILILPGITRPGVAALAAWWRAHRRVIVSALLAIAGVVVFLAAFGSLGDQLVQLFRQPRLEWLPEAVIGYTASPGKGLFVFSPVLLLGLVGVVMLARAGRWRQALMPLAMLAGFVLGYALLRNELWTGGLGWGPRYMVPITPFLMLAALPVFQDLLDHKRTWARVAVTYLALLSIGIQLLGTVMPVANYYYWIRGGTAWDVGVWVPTQTHIFINFILFVLFGNRDVAWWTLGRDFSIPLLCGLLMALAAAGVVYVRRRKSRLRWRQVGALAAAALIALSGLFVYALSRYTARDARYLVEDDALHAMLAYLGANVAPDDAVVLSNPNYQPFFLNFNKQRDLFVVTLPNSPDPSASPRPLLVDAGNPDGLILKRIARTMHTRARAHDTLWLVVDGSRYVSDRPRPVEHWMARHYFPVDQHEITPLVRVVRYSTADPPSPVAPPGPGTPAGATFGGTFTLAGYDLAGAPYHAGEAVNVSLVWRVESAPDTDYTVGLFVVGPDGVPRAERHSEPLGGFGQTYFWEPGQVWRDNHALYLPADLPPGPYTLRLIVYTWYDGQRLPVTDATGGALGDVLDFASFAVE
ncbi:MAG: hypothetical protein Kow00120_25570 [Anaerolineae bacterium]